MDPTTLTSKRLPSIEQCYSNIECEILENLYVLEKFHHYCFAKEVYVITDYRPLITIFSKDVATLSQKLKCIILHIHQYSVCIIHISLAQTYTSLTSCPGTTIQKKRLENHWHEHKYECHQHSSKYASMHIHRRHTSTNMWRCLPAEAESLHHTWWTTQKRQIRISIRHYWPVKSEIAMIDGFAMKGKRIIIHFLLQKQILQQLHGNHMGILKMRLLACESILDKYQSWLQKHCKTVCHMHGIPTNTAIFEDNTTWDAAQTLGGECGELYSLLKIIHY